MKKTGTFFLNRDDLKMGLCLGFILPLFVFIIIYILRDSFGFYASSFGDYLKIFFTEKTRITFVGVWCMVGNIALFTYYINTNKDKTGKGIFAVTLLYGIAVLLLKLLK